VIAANQKQNRSIAIADLAAPRAALLAAWQNKLAFAGSPIPPCRVTLDRTSVAARDNWS